MNEDDITAYLQQFSLEQLTLIKAQVEQKALELKAKREPRPVRAVVGMPPTPPKDIAALADAADLDISGLLRDIDRRRR